MDTEIRGRNQALLNAWNDALDGGWASTVDGLPASLAYAHWLEEKLAARDAGEQRLERAIEMADAALRRHCLINEAAVLELALAAWKEVR